METTSPIVYKMIPTQYAFFVAKDGTLKIHQVSDIHKEMKFESEAKARQYVENYKEQL